MNKQHNPFNSLHNIRRISTTHLSQPLSYEFLSYNQFNTWDNINHNVFYKKPIRINSINRKNPLLDYSKILDFEQVEKQAAILIIDDEEVCLQSIEIMLMGTQYSVITLNKSVKALKYIYANLYNIDLILLDLNMPEMSGLELLEKIKSDKMIASIPVILQSACTDKSEIEKAFKLNISSFLQKPYNKNQVLKAIKKALNKK